MFEHLLNVYEEFCSLGQITSALFEGEASIVAVDYPIFSTRPIKMTGLETQGV